MSNAFHQKIAVFHRNTIQKMRNAGLSAYVLREDGSVVHFRFDGKREVISSSSIPPKNSRSEPGLLTTS